MPKMFKSRSFYECGIYQLSRNKPSPSFSQSLKCKNVSNWDRWSSFPSVQHPANILCCTCNQTTRHCRLSPPQHRLISAWCRRSDLREALMSQCSWPHRLHLNLTWPGPRQVKTKWGTDGSALQSKTFTEATWPFPPRSDAEILCFPDGVLQTAAGE